MLTTGIFPDAFKLSKVIPLFKKSDSSLLVNYRPISLLPSYNILSSYNILIVIIHHYIRLIAS